MPTRLISFAGSTVAVEYQGDRPAKIIDFLFRDIPTRTGCPAHITYRLQSVEQSDWLRLYQNGELLRERDQEADLAEILLGNTCYNLADRSQGGLLFHGAGLTWQGHGLLLPGTMGAGKSTLAAWLLSRGYDYLTDELVFIPQGTSQMQTFSRPLNLKPPARAVLSQQFDFAGQTAHMLSSPTTDLVPAHLFNSNSRFSDPTLSLIIFPRYRAGAEFEWQSLSKAQAGLELMQCLINARNLSEHGFPEITRLTRTIPAYKLSYASFDQIGDRVERVLSSLP